MIRQIGVQIEGDKFIRLINLDKDTRGNLNLTTIKDLQKRAVIKIFLFQNDRMVPIKEIEVSNIPPEKAGVPDINLSTEFDGKRNLTLLVVLNGGAANRTVVDIKKFSIERKRGLVLIPIVIILAFAVFLFTRGGASLREMSTIFSFDKISFLSRSAGLDKKVEREEFRVNDEKALQDEGSKGVTGELKQDAQREIAAEINEKVLVKEQGGSKGTVVTPGEREAPDDVSYDAGAKVEAPDVVSYEAGTRVETSEIEKEKAPVSAPAESEPAVKDEEGRLNTKIKEPVSAAAIFETETIYFKPGSALLSPDALKKLDEVLTVLRDYPDVKFLISGHCALYSTEQGRLQLSVIRASRVYEYLIKNGWKPGVRPDVTGFGGMVYVTTDPEYQHLNRRVEIKPEG